MQTAAIGDARHRTTERIDLAHELPLGAAADRRIARQRADLLRIAGHEQRVDAEARGRERRFDARVTSSDDDDPRVITVHMHSRRSAL